MASALGIQDANRQNAMTGYSNLAQLEKNRDGFNDQMKAGQQAKMASGISSGIAVGMMTGNPFIGVGVALLGGFF